MHILSLTTGYAGANKIRMATVVDIGACDIGALGVNSSTHIYALCIILWKWSPYRSPPPLDKEGFICHFVKGQINPFIPNGMNYVVDWKLIIFKHLKISTIAVHVSEQNLFFERIKNNIATAKSIFRKNKKYYSYREICSAEA